jgi:hypothetical protein
VSVQDIEITVAKGQSEEHEENFIPINFEGKSKPKKKRASRSKLFSTPSAFDEDLKAIEPNKILQNERRRSHSSVQIVKESLQ